jgi:nitroreductase
MDLFDAIEGRRSIRSFADRPVDRVDLLRMLDAATRAPSGGNLQPWRFAVVDDPGTRDAMVSAIRREIDELPRILAGDAAGASYFAQRFTRSSLFFGAAPVTIAVLVREDPQYRSTVEFFLERGFDIYQAMRCTGFVGTQSVAAAVENLLLAAHALGYGACWMNPPFIAKGALEAILGVEPPWDLQALVPVGRPDPGHGPPPASRKARDEVVSFTSMASREDEEPA